MPKLKLAPIAEGLLLDTDGLIRCDYCNRWMGAGEQKTVTGAMFLGRNVLAVYHPDCYRLDQRGGYRARRSFK